jgi:hypothetical protein
MAHDPSFAAISTLLLALSAGCGGVEASEGGLSAIAGEGGEVGSDAGPALDLGSGEQQGGCTKVDLLFVIDDSYSMANEQGALIASFPNFIEGVRGSLDETDSYHIGVITTDAYAFNTLECRELGALVTQTGGLSSSDRTCGPFVEGRYMSESDDLDSAFSCAAQVGVEGSNDERPIAALLAALEPADVTACNAGFRRDDALLVVVIITDEEDDHSLVQGEAHGSPGDPADWFAALTARVGVETNAVVLAITGGHPDDACSLSVGLGAEDAPRLREFAELFTHGYLGDVCAGSYEPFFLAAIEVVERGCAGFVPVP